MAEKRKFGIGIQEFDYLVKNDCVYVDKTGYVYRMAHSGSKNFFLSRPRRFGKSLLISTLAAYFEGRKELFEGLEAGRLETEWTKYPVLRINLSMGKYYSLERAESIISSILNDLERKFGLEQPTNTKYSDRLKKVIQAAYEQTGQHVVILIDEYDAPMLDTINNEELQDQIRERVRDLFSPLKSMEHMLRFVFLTGISKFSQLSVFSELNNLNVLTFEPAYEGVCGITEEELLTFMRPDIENLTEAMNEWMHITYEETVAKLKDMYDGYHFSKKMTDIYNPWSLTYAFEKGDISNYWFSTGTPSSLINLLRKKTIELPELEGCMATLDQFDAPTERITDPTPVLFQSGYLTLKAYDGRRGKYKLGFPNREVREGFARSLYKYYRDDDPQSGYTVMNAFTDFKFGDTTFGDFLKVVQRWYAGIPYSLTDRNQNEQLYQSLFYALLTGAGANIEAERQTSDGRLDIALKMADAIYILEFKYGKTAEDAVRQVQDKDYAAAFATDPRPVYAVGLNISADRRTIESTDIQLVQKNGKRVPTA